MGSGKPAVPEGARGGAEVASPSPDRKWRLAKTREGKRAVTFYVPDAAYEQFQILCVKRRTSVNEMMREAMDKVFEEAGLPRLAGER